MLHFSRWKILAILLTCFAGIWTAMPNFFPKDTVKDWPWPMPKSQINLGLDLRGGAHLLLAMEPEEIRKDWLGILRDDVKKALRQVKIGTSGLGIQGGGLQIKLSDPAKIEEALTEIRKLNAPIGNAILGQSGFTLDITKGSEPGTITLTPTEQGIRERISSAASASIETVRRRVDLGGNVEPIIVRQGQDRILLQVPGFDDTKKLKDLIGSTAKLTFHEVHKTLSVPDAKLTSIPPDFKIFPASKEEGEEVLLRITPVVQGDDLTDAQPGFDNRNGQPIISFRFNQSGARRFAEYTKEHVGERFAIVLDGVALSAPVIQEPILQGQGQISGNFTTESANTLAVQLRSGALPTKLTVIEERTVGPSLGADSIESGKMAGLIGGLAVMGLTILAYGTFGIFAVVGLLVHLILTLALMTAFGSTLTLPGIAGLVLGVAMAVDANVLIYERIREELRAGKTPISAIDAGFTRAFITIADSQLTTLACALIMFWLGSGPIRGFAVTLTIGILTSIFASVTVVRLLVSYWIKSETADGRKKIEVPV